MMDDYKLKQLLDIFLFEKQANLTAKTYTYYNSSMRYFTDFITDYLHKPLPDIYMLEINLAILNQYTMYLRNKPYSINVPDNGSMIIKSDVDKHIKNTSIATYQRAVRAFFRWCYDNEYTIKNIAQRYKLLKSDASEKLPLYGTEVKKIDAGFDSKTVSGLRNYCIVHLMLDCGLRLNEVVRLKIPEVMMDKNVIYINCSKGLKSRYVPLVSDLKINIYKYLTFFRNCKDFSLNLPLFVNINNGAPITEHTIKQLFSRLKKRTDIERLHPHLCRHTFATSYILGGGDLESLRIYMGHSDITTTTKYLHLANTYKLLNTDVYKLDDIYFKRYY